MKTLLILLTLANAGDAGLTIRNRAQANCYELNPVLRPAFHEGRGAIGVTFGAATVGEWIIGRKLAHHHPKLARTLLSGELVGEGWGIAESARDAPRDGERR